MTEQQDKRRTPCPSCKGRGRVNCILGSLVCGDCNGSGTIDLTQPQDFASKVRRTLEAKGDSHD